MAMGLESTGLRDTWHSRCSLDPPPGSLRVGGETTMQVQLFVAPRSVASGEPGLVLGAALILAYFLLSTAMVQDFRRSSPPPLVGLLPHPCRVRG